MFPTHTPAGRRSSSRPEPLPPGGQPDPTRVPRPHLVRVLTAAGADAPLSVDHIIEQLRELLPPIGEGHDR
ncbi:MAG: hypothetical protein ACREQ5_02550 [Candidatus Dormibacteria bacterium]